MWKYSEKLMDHFMNPRNVGQMEDPDGHSEVGSPQCGDAMTLDILVDDDDLIEDVRFQTFGCAAAVASASAMTELVKGRHIDEARKIRNSEIVEYVGGMPAEKFHCSVMGHDALSAAIADFREKRDRVREALDALLSDMPEGLREKLRGAEGGVAVRHVHPSRVILGVEGADAGEVALLVGGELSRRVGRQVEVRVT